MVYPPSPTCDIHILGRESAKSRRLRGEGGVVVVARGRGERGREWREGWAEEVGGGWQSVEASGADQWPDGGNSGILTPYTAKGVCRCCC